MKIVKNHSHHTHINETKSPLIFTSIVLGPQAHSVCHGNTEAPPLSRHTKCPDHCNQRLCKILTAWVNFLTKHTVFCHKFNLLSIFCSVFFLVKVMRNAGQ